MKRILCVLLLYAMIFSSLTSCGPKQDKDITCEDVIAAYEAEGYVVTHYETPEKDDGYLCCLIIETEDSRSLISFKFFETEAEAQAEADNNKWHIILWFYSAVMSEPLWVHTKSYKNIEIEYDSADLYKPFGELIK